MAFGLDDAASAIQIISSAKSLFGKKKSEKSSMKDQLAMQLTSAKQMPSAQVEGLRNAGLNPMLAVGNGISAPPNITSSPGAEDNASSAKSLAASTAANQAAQAQLYSAQADKTKAETLSEAKRPANIEADTTVKQGVPDVQKAEIARGWEQAGLAGATASLQRQLTATEDFKTKKAATDSFFRDLEYRLASINLGPRQSAEIRKITAEARSAETEADLSESLRELERVAGVAGKVAGTARSLFNYFKK